MVLQPYPDEFMAGHMYRLIYRNGFERPSQLAVELPATRGDNGLGFYGPPHKGVAQLCGIPVEDYLSRHSLRNLIFGCHTRRPSEDSVTGMTPYLFNANVPAAGRPVRLCPECRDEDLKTFDCAYWHRSHQVPGVDLCPTHSVPLMNFSRRTIRDHPNPSSIVGPIAPDAVLSAADAQPVKRYRALCSDLLDMPRPPSKGSLSGLIKKLGAEQGLAAEQFWPYSHGTLDQHIPEPWVRHHVMIAERRPLPTDWPNCTYLLQLCCLSPYTDAVLDALHPPPPKLDFSKMHLPLDVSHL